MILEASKYSKDPSTLRTLYSFVVIPRLEYLRLRYSGLFTTSKKNKIRILLLTNLRA